MALRRLNLCRLGEGQVAVCYADGNEPSGLIECGDIPDWLNKY